MSTMTQTEGLLTKEDVSYLRRADDVYAINIEGQNFLRVIKRARYGDAFDSDKRVDIRVPGNGQHGYFTSAWGFPWGSLRAGDRVSLYWYPDANTNELLRQVSLHADVLYLDVKHGKQSPVRYIADVSVCADNSARMCRSHVSGSFG